MSVYVSCGAPDAMLWIRGIVETHAGPVVSVTRGEGVWEGTAEPCVIVVGASSTPDLDGLRLELAEVAARYGEEAIALAVAEVEFVERREAPWR